MKINATITKKPFMNFKTERKINTFDASLITITIVLAAGIIAGIIIFIFSKSIFIKELLDYFIKFSNDLNGKNFIESVSGFMLNNILFALCLIFAGTSSLGELVIYPVIFFKSSGLGAIAAYLIKNYRTSGMGYYFLGILPGKIIFIFGLLFLSQSAIQSSRRIKNSLNFSNKEEINMRLYYARAVMSILIFIASSVIDTTTIKMFDNFFNLPF